ncbi:MAG TPA: hypothetical protein PK668_10860 [Myxococcota bacterium]|nr:hypothetical protein [Myxococcota bacterium]HRY93336.1 hypothetical protein [Myxococcota bacterium]HSA21051.1 hypothetical protein [Myxococcota bacterium]
MRPPPTAWLPVLGLLLALGPGACCHLNRLASLSAPLGEVSVEAANLGSAFLVLERRADRAEGVVMRGGGGLSNVFNRYHRAVEALGDGRLAEGLSVSLAVALERSLGWAAAEGERSAMLRAEVEELRILATDPAASVQVRWQVWAELRDAGGEVLWRDCLEVERPVQGLSLERLLVADDDERARVQAALAREMADAIADRLRADARPGASAPGGEGKP